MAGGTGDGDISAGELAAQLRQVSAELQALLAQLGRGAQDGCASCSEGQLLLGGKPADADADADAEGDGEA